MGIYYLEDIYLYKSEYSSVDPNINGGEITNYPYFYRLSDFLFNKIGIADITKGYAWRKIFIHNKTNRTINRMNIFILPLISGFDYFNEKYQFYLNYGDIDNISDVETDIDITKSHGILSLYQTIYFGNDYILVSIDRENIIKQDTQNIKTICIYNKTTLSIYDIINVIDVQNYDGNIYLLRIDKKFTRDYNKDEYALSSAIVYENIKPNKLIKFWNGIEIYDIHNDYIIDFSIYIHWFEQNFE